MSLVLLALVLAVSTPVPVSGAELVADGAAYDGELVVVEGELVGDYGRRGDGTVWTQLNDDPYVYEPVAEGGPLRGGNVGIGVRIPAELAEDLDPPGGYRIRGPVVRLTGTWRYHDPARGGESYLDVVALEVVEPGRTVPKPLHPVALVVGVLLLVVAFGLWRSYVAERDRL
ncbi:MAG TPA: hypothetical protein ENK55_10435 [Actinobacteria bacterium]|nr:hypothetical protein [Actinomycetota bacterium]